MALPCLEAEAELPYLVAVGGVVLWLIFVLVAHDSGFPTLKVLGMSVGCAVGAVLYYALMELLMPESQRSSR